eukprot:SAG25_NODE_6871_length_522_cov_2.524823_1_plen_106_part_00
MTAKEKSEVRSRTPAPHKTPTTHSLGGLPDLASCCDKDTKGTATPRGACRPPHIYGVGNGITLGFLGWQATAMRNMQSRLGLLTIVRSDAMRRSNLRPLACLKHE